MTSCTLIMIVTCSICIVGSGLLAVKNVLANIALGFGKRQV